MGPQGNRKGLSRSGTKFHNVAPIYPLGWFAHQGTTDCRWGSGVLKPIKTCAKCWQENGFLSGHSNAPTCVIFSAYYLVPQTQMTMYATETENKCQNIGQRRHMAHLHFFKVS
jgi:hypothetical protein